MPLSITQLLKRAHCACHTERLWTPDETSWNVTKCHACQTKQGFATFETAFAAVPIGTAIAASQERLRTVAEGCGLLRTVTGRLRSGRLRTQKERRVNTTSTTRSGKNSKFLQVLLQRRAMIIFKWRNVDQACSANMPCTSCASSFWNVIYPNRCCRFFGLNEMARNLCMQWHQPGFSEFTQRASF